MALLTTHILAITTDVMIARRVAGDRAFAGMRRVVLACRTRTRVLNRGDSRARNLCTGYAPAGPLPIHATDEELHFRRAVAGSTL